MVGTCSRELCNKQAGWQTEGGTADGEGMASLVPLQSWRACGCDTDERTMGAAGADPAGRQVIVEDCLMRLAAVVSPQPPPRWSHTQERWTQLRDGLCA